ncbi:TRAP transporter substrate-binding protein [Shewanella sp. GXUN23E]|uniref:TRAP transporter substrate-binding protein n=1 Tax=Shewanella sp. GXUN23E TaxID=3422498 RepID=UPI003D7C8D11
MITPAVNRQRVNAQVLKVLAVKAKAVKSSSWVKVAALPGLIALWLLVGFAAMAAHPLGEQSQGKSPGVRWDMPTPYGDATHHSRNLRAFAQDVAQTSGNELQIVLHTGASLFKHNELPRAVRSRLVPIVEVFGGLLGNEDPLFKLDNLPFLATDFDAAHDLYLASKPEMEAALAQQGLMLLFSVPWPPQGLYSQQPVNDLADFKGARMRAYSPVTSRLALLLASQPTTVQTVEIPQAFSTGMIEMMITSPTTGVSSQSWDYVSHYTDIQAWLPRNLVLVNRQAFERLSPKAQQALLAAAAQAEARGWQWAQQETLEKTAQLAAQGMQVSPPSPALMQGLKQTGEVMTLEWLQEAGARGEAVLERYRQRRSHQP